MALIQNYPEQIDNTLQIVFKVRKPVCLVLELNLNSFRTLLISIQILWEPSSCHPFL